MILALLQDLRKEPLNYGCLESAINLFVKYLKYFWCFRLVEVVTFLVRSAY